MKKLVLVFLLSLPQLAFAIGCRPSIDGTLPQYIIGYGSLMDEHSKKITVPEAEDNFPVVIKGYQRGWSIHSISSGLNATFLSATEDRNASFNAVIFKLNDPNSVAQYDKREKSYCRKQVNPEQLFTYNLKLPAHKQIWIYYSTQQSNQPPVAEFPIVQSYIDIFLRGCIKIEQKFKIDNFAKTCISSTSQWSIHWENDRIFPRRPFIYEPFALQIDALLKESLPKTFAKIKYP